MADDDLVRAMLSEQTSGTDAINRLVELSGRAIDQFEMIRLFKLAFPEIPLRILIEASASRLIVGDSGIGDDDLNVLLDPWLSAGR